MRSRRVYLAGPEVFLPQARELIERKRALSASVGFEPSPLHADLSPGDAATPLGRGIGISRRNERRMDEAEICIANLTPFRGISADVGTVYELGYMAAQGKLVFGYTHEPRDYSERVAAYDGGTARDEEGILRMTDGQMVEDHGMSDNLMLEGGILLREGALIRAAQWVPWDDLGPFTRCLQHIRDVLRSGA
ncbi:MULTISPECIES: nucleoside 2-deoxyribosyltransferase [Bacteria]|uniref:nucleoside 2-deoxyribosyltransferase n=1 Tax=Microbacterium sp. TaxID=51671 RepID=UPI0025ED6653|nr:nucleoside 2-deoxyribosyltransferase [Microbacterium sp.]